MLSESFLQALKWYFLSICIIIGTTAFIISNKSSSVAPIGVGVFAYGIAYIMTAVWKDFRGKFLLASMAVFMAITMASPYVPTALYVLFAYEGAAQINPYILWGFIMGVVGIPVMTLIYRRIG